jgi:hypothetical protein
MNIYHVVPLRCDGKEQIVIDSNKYSRTAVMAAICQCFPTDGDAACC